MSKYLRREDILNAPDILYEAVEVPEWGGTVRIRGLTGSERDEFEASIIQRRGKDIEANLKNIRAKLVSLAAVDEEGNRIFTEEDVVALGRKSARVLDRLFSVAQRLSGLSSEDVEDLAKNSVNGQ
jgi:hypothetical protein